MASHFACFVLATVAVTSTSAQGPDTIIISGAFERPDTQSWKPTDFSLGFAITKDHLNYGLKQYVGAAAVSFGPNMAIFTGGMTPAANGAIGGVTGATQIFNKAEAQDGGVTTGPQMQQSRFGHGIAYDAGKTSDGRPRAVYVCGGRDGIGFISSCEQLLITADIASAFWTTIAPLPVATVWLSLTVSPGGLIAIGGLIDTKNTTSAQVYAWDPNSPAVLGKWRPHSTLPQPLAGTAAIQWPKNETTVLCGGFTSGSPLPSALCYSYDPASQGQWNIATGKLTHPRAYFSMVALTDADTGNQITYAAGGTDEYGPLSVVDEFIHFGLDARACRTDLAERVEKAATIGV